LVVDDEAAIRQIARATLENNGYRVLTADNGVEAVAVYKKHQSKIQAVVLDSMMPFMDGAATAQVLKEISPTVRIIGVSGLADSERPAGGMIAAQVFLTKPYGAGQLMEALHRVLTAAA
jgi:CheY-like chemotaxis protein